MLREFLSDFSILGKPTYQPDTFRPYFSPILTIVTVTIVLYSMQIMTKNFLTYANTSINFQNTALQNKKCTTFSHMTAKYLCGKGQKTSNYLFEPFSVEQALQKLTN